MIQLKNIVDEVLLRHGSEWKDYALKWLETQMMSIDLLGGATLDKEENLDLPEKLLHQLDAEWSAELEVIAELKEDICAWQQAYGWSNVEILDELKKVAEDLREIDYPISPELRAAYDSALEETWFERITDTNYKDILRFDFQLREHLYRNLEEMTQWHMAKVLDIVKFSF